jgi:hypothetical protein
MVFTHATRVRVPDGKSFLFFFGINFWENFSTQQWGLNLGNPHWSRRSGYMVFTHATRVLVPDAESFLAY